MFMPLGYFLRFLPQWGRKRFNLVDALNGLSSYISVSVALSLSVISFTPVILSISIFSLNYTCHGFGGFKFSFWEDFFR